MGLFDILKRKGPDGELSAEFQDLIAQIDQIKKMFPELCKQYGSNMLLTEKIENMVKLFIKLIKELADLRAKPKTNPAEAMILDSKFEELKTAFENGCKYLKNPALVVGGQEIIDDYNEACRYYELAKMPKDPELEGQAEGVLSSIMLQDDLELKVAAIRQYADGLTEAYRAQKEELNTLASSVSSVIRQARNNGNVDLISNPFVAQLEREVAVNQEIYAIYEGLRLESTKKY